MPSWQIKKEIGAFPFHADEIDVTTMLLDNGLGNTQTQSGSAFFAGIGTVRLGEALEHA